MAGVEKLRVLEIIRSLDHGGAEAAMVRRLRRQPPDVETVVLTAEPERNHFTPEVAAVTAGVHSKVISWTDAKWLRSFVRRVDPDVVVIHSPREAFRSLAWFGGTDIPIVVVAHSQRVADRVPLVTLPKLAMRAVNSRAVLHIAVSRLAAEGPLCAGASRVVVCHLGAEVSQDADPWNPWPREARVRLLSLSRLVPPKNVEALVEAVGLVAPQLRAHEAHLALVGDGPRRESIARMIKNRNVDDLVSMHGSVENPGNILRAADVLVVSSLSEGGPLTVFESLMAGCRVLSTPVGVAPDVLNDDDGHLVLQSARVCDLSLGLEHMVIMGPVPEPEREHRRELSAQWDVGKCALLFYAHLREVARKPQHVV